jgi:hypothetical protein
MEFLLYDIYNDFLNRVKLRNHNRVKIITPNINGLNANNSPDNICLSSSESIV